MPDLIDDRYTWRRYWQDRDWSALTWAGLANIAAIAALWGLWCLVVWLAVLSLDFVGMMP